MIIFSCFKSNHTVILCNSKWGMNCLCIVMRKPDIAVMQETWHWCGQSKVCNSYKRYTANSTYYIHINCPRNMLSGVSCSETEVTLVMQPVPPILLLEFHFFFFWGREWENCQYVRERKGTKAWRKREVSLISNGDRCL